MPSFPSGRKNMSLDPYKSGITIRTGYGGCHRFPPDTTSCVMTPVQKWIATYCEVNIEDAIVSLRKQAVPATPTDALERRKPRS